MRRTLLGAAGAFVIATVAFAGNASAQCWWTGLGYYSCAAEPSVEYSPYPYSYAGPVGATPYAAWNAWDYRDYRLQPMWLPSYPGPKPSGGTFGVR